MWRSKSLLFRERLGLVGGESGKRRPDRLFCLFVSLFKQRSFDTMPHLFASRYMGRNKINLNLFNYLP